jgi:hypothetical protein
MRFETGSKGDASWLYRTSRIVSDSTFSEAIANDRTVQCHAPSLVQLFRSRKPRLLSGQLEA